MAAADTARAADLLRPARPGRTARTEHLNLCCTALQSSFACENAERRIFARAREDSSCSP